MDVYWFGLRKNEPSACWFASGMQWKWRVFYVFGCSLALTPTTNRLLVITIILLICIPNLIYILKSLQSSFVFCPLGVGTFSHISLSALKSPQKLECGLPSPFNAFRLIYFSIYTICCVLLRVYPTPRTKLVLSKTNLTLPSIRRRSAVGQRRRPSPRASAGSLALPALPLEIVAASADSAAPPTPARRPAAPPNSGRPLRTGRAGPAAPQDVPRWRGEQQQ